MRVLGALALAALVAVASANHHHTHHAAAADGGAVHPLATAHGPCSSPPDLDAADFDGLSKKKGFFHVSCDGDVTGFGGGGSAAAEAARLLAEAADANVTRGGGGKGWGIVKRVCHGTLRLAWECPEHRAAACAECKGTHVWLKAPCGATVAVCDGLQHFFMKASLGDDNGGGGDGNGDTKLYVGAGALGTSSMVRAPPSPHRRQAGSEGDEAAVEGSACKLGKRHTKAHWAHSGISGKVASHKKPDWRHPLSDAPLGDGAALAAEARAALAEDGLVLLPPGAGVGAAVTHEPEADVAPPGNTTEGGAAAKSWGRFECNDRDSLPLIPCVGSSEWKVKSDGRHPAMRVACDGAYSGALGFGCAGLHTARLDYEGHGKHGGSARVYKQCSGKSGAKFLPRVRGMATWCKGRASGAALAECGGCKKAEGPVPK